MQVEHERSKGSLCVLGWAGLGWRAQLTIMKALCYRRAHYHIMGNCLHIPGPKEL